MELLNGLALGFSEALTPYNLAVCFVGVLWGTLVGVLPGIGPMAGIAVLLPVTYNMEVTPAIIMMAGIYYGAMYGGSTTSILMRIPGEVANVVTCIDGHEMARRGRAGQALAIAALSSFAAGILSTIGLALIGVPLISVAIRFGPPEYFALGLAGLTLAAYLGGESVLKGIAAGLFGLMLGTVGASLTTGSYRYTFDLVELYGGVGILPVAVGLYGVAEVLSSLDESLSGPKPVKQSLFRMRELLPSREESAKAAPAAMRGSVLGFFLGILPGAAATVSSFASYALERRISKRPEEFGQGAVEGLAGPEAANNAATGGAMVPLLALGLPFSVVTALMLNAMTMNGVNPSPLLMKNQPEFFWAIVVSMLIGNVMLLVLNLPLVGVWASLLRIPYRRLYPCILLFCIIGVYTTTASTFSLWVMLVFGVLGYFMRKLDIPSAPVLLGMVLLPYVDGALGQSLLMASGNPTIFFTRPISASILGVLALVLVVPLLRKAIPGRAGKPASTSSGTRWKTDERNK